MPSTRWFKDDNGKIYQIDNVVQITIASPLIARGTFRDSPPVVPAAAGVIVAADSTTLIVPGGVTPAIAFDPAVAVEPFTVNSPSSIAQDDAFAHVDLRFVFGPEPMIFFETSDALATNPDSSTFSKTRPATDFEAFDVDCCFGWTPDCGVFNSPPPGWAPGSDT